MELKASRTVYTSWGKGRRELLRFSKHGNARVEELFSTHYVQPKVAAEKKPQPDELAGEMAGEMAGEGKSGAT